MLARGNRRPDTAETERVLHSGQIPKELRRLRQWVAVRFEPNPSEPSKPARATLIPRLGYRTGRHEGWRGPRDSPESDSCLPMPTRMSELISTGVAIPTAARLQNGQNESSRFCLRTRSCPSQAPAFTSSLRGVCRPEFGTSLID